MDKRKLIIPASIIGIVIIALTVTLLIISFSGQTEDNSYGNYENTVVLSDNLNYILDDDLDKYSRSSADDAINEYFLSLYPSGVGLNISQYQSTSDSYSIRLITSHGTFHTLTVIENDESVTIKLDQTFEKDYPIIEPEHDDEEEEEE